MKRSEMIESMVSNWIGLFPGEEWTEELKEDVYTNMSNLLSMLEYKGMMPPDTGNGLVIGTQYMSTHLDYSKEPQYKWESE